MRPLLAVLAVALALPVAALAQVPHGGEGTVTRHAVGPLAIGESTRADVEAFAGVPDAVIPDENPFGNVTHSILGYDCTDREGFADCRTYYGIEADGERLTNFDTRSRAFITKAGSRVGMKRRAARRREGRRIKGGCFGFTITRGREAPVLLIGFGKKRVRSLTIHGPGGGLFWSC